MIVKLMNKTNTSIPVLERSGVTAIKDGDKASMLNKYFSECFNMAQPSLSENQSQLKVNGECPVDFMCTEEEVYSMLISLDTIKANGSERISAKMFERNSHQHHHSIDKTIQYFDIWKIS